MLRHLRQLVYHPRRKLKNIYYGLKYGIKNLWFWLPYIWKDRDYDGDFIFIILYAKIQKQRKALEKAQSWVHFKHGEIEKIKRVEYVLKQIMGDDSLSERSPYWRRAGWDKHEERWGELQMKFQTYEDDPKYSQLIFHREHIKTEKDKRVEKRQFRKLMKHEEYLKNQDKEYALNQIAKYSGIWWI